MKGGARAWLLPAAVVAVLLVASAVLWTLAWDRPSAERQPWVAAAASTFVAAMTFAGSLVAQQHTQRLTARVASDAQRKTCYVDFMVAAAEYSLVLARRLAAERTVDRLSQEIQQPHLRDAAAESAARAGDEFELRTQEVEARRLQLVGMLARIRLLDSDPGARLVAEAAQAVLDAAADRAKLQVALAAYDQRVRDVVGI